MTAVGLLLAAGQGRRMGRPKALVHASDGSSWLLSSRARMLEAGCSEVLVVLGAEARQAEALLRADPAAVAAGDTWSIVAERWAEGMGESMRAGLLELIAGPHDIALVHLVDLPDVGAPVMRRLLDGSDASSLKRAVYGGAPGHPVVVGRDHWQNLVDTLSGDTGAKEYLRSRGAVPVECGDLATGRDVDTPDGV